MTYLTSSFIWFFSFKTFTVTRMVPYCRPFFSSSQSKLIRIWFVHCALYLGAQGKFQPVDQVVTDEEFPACTRLLRCSRSLASLHHIAEEKGNTRLKTNQQTITKHTHNHASMSRGVCVCNAFWVNVKCFFLCPEVGQLKFHRYSQDRTLNWLKKKVRFYLQCLVIKNKIKKKHYFESTDNKCIIILNRYFSKC